jgi:hypothetical protein
MKNLMQQLSPESLAIIEAEKSKFELTTQQIIDDLESNFWPTEIKFKTVVWLAYNICDDFDAMKIFNLFKNKVEEEVGS